MELSTLIQIKNNTILDVCSTVALKVDWMVGWD